MRSVQFGNTVLTSVQALAGALLGCRSVLVQFKPYWRSPAPARWCSLDPAAPLSCGGCLPLGVHRGWVCLFHFPGKRGRGVPAGVGPAQPFLVREHRPTLRWLGPSTPLLVLHRPSLCGEKRVSHQRAQPQVLSDKGCDEALRPLLVLPGSGPPPGDPGAPCRRPHVPGP